jgi:hypothetical protein
MKIRIKASTIVKLLQIGAAIVTTVFGTLVVQSCGR